MQLEAKNISLIYDIDKNNEGYALREVSIMVKPGEMVALLGPSGSGKSSLIYALSGLRKVTSGEVCYDGMNVESLSEKALSELRRKKFGLIFQGHLLVDYLSVFQNIMISSYKRDSAAADRAQNLLVRLGISHLKDKRPHELTLGQKHRVAVARSLINQPEILFADEPTAVLDHKNAMEIMTVLKEQLDTASVVVATHDPLILEGIERVITLRDGRIAKLK